jgi:voltage-gated potassium channel
MKKKIYALVARGSHGSKINAYFDYAIMTLILLNVIVLMLESIIVVNQYFADVFRTFEIFSVIIFTGEYLMRIFVSDLLYPSTSRYKSAFLFVFSFYGLIDLLAILPFYLPFLIGMDLRFIRILRLLRFFRILKLNRYNDSISLIWAVIKEKKTELVITGFVTFLLLFIASFLMYYIEGEIQPDAFPNVLASFWWAIATLTTVGYGDVYPLTPLGKILSGFIAVLGIGLVALPTGLISAGFLEKINKRKSQSRKCPHCGNSVDE